ncbi:hypothetical protein QTI17_34750 [Variovorax sp. J31P179]|uniref:hypothetical protein n=1 Tax=Variovorax sp. J31P179 TaxID=3053508 RepID=UPI002575728A|nr:hypothetical protein [Variovorax sp. J31P179]MDM0085750.1 hypothetical protein [Variovorax sp. J31P179]
MITRYERYANEIAELICRGPCGPATASRYRPNTNDREGLVMHCGSFSKVLAPGYRVGWVAGGRFARRIEHLRIMHTLSPATPSMAAIASYLAEDG